jgi:hypothetical protein
MTTGNRGFTHLHLPWDDIGTSQNKGGLTLTIFSAETARHVLAGAFSALRALDPDGAVLVRATSGAVFEIHKILPDRELTLTGCRNCAEMIRHAIPGKCPNCGNTPPRAVAGPPVDLGDDPDGDSTQEPAPFTSPDLVTPDDQRGGIYTDADGRFRSPEAAAAHAIHVQGGFSTPAREARRMLADAVRGGDAQEAAMAREWLEIRGLSLEGDEEPGSTEVTR